ncbi:MAG: SBBP repeat-containing protein [Bacteroidia bacterium]|nr:SBBP repeat-containing protein [Bacteroidia bacterium]
MEALFLLRAPGADFWITQYGLNLTYWRIEASPEALWYLIPGGKQSSQLGKEPVLLGHRIRIDLEDHAPLPLPEGRHPLPGFHHYLKGNDPNRYIRFVSFYKEAYLRNVYIGIDLRFYLDNGLPRFDFLVSPWADPKQIRLRISGADTIHLSRKALVLGTRFGTVQLCDLRAYQEGKEIESYFVKRGEVYEINLGAYDPSKPLVIDPLVFSTYVGGSGFDIGTGIAVNAAGEPYICGWTASPNYDITAGAFQNTFGGVDWDAFVTRLTASGNGLIYSTYLGGTALDQAGNLAIDSDGNAYITGTTKSMDFPVTAAARQTTHAGGPFMYDGFVTKLDPTGASLVYSTYLGATGDDGGIGIALNSLNEAFISGWTGSSSSLNGFPATPGAVQGTYGGSVHDAFVSRLSSDGSMLIFSTYIGGNGDDRGLGIALDASGNPYTTGWTSSTNFPLNTPFQNTYDGGAYDVFVVKLNSAGNTRLYSTYIGGSGDDRGYGIAVDQSGSAYVTGWSNSPNYDVTAGALQTTYGGGSYDIVV